MKKKNFNPPGQRSLFEKQDEMEALKEKSEHYFFLWEDFTFHKNEVVINPNRHKKIFPHIPLAGSLEILNQIKQEYFERLHPKPVKLFFYEKRFQAGISKDWAEVTKLIEAAAEFYHFRYTRTAGARVIRLDKLQPAQVIQLLGDQLGRSQYLKYLASIQNELYSIIPILEYQNHQQEESFIFRLKTLTNRTLIVWENAKMGRASHLFIASSGVLDLRLKLIESFVMNEIDAKRSLLHDKAKQAKIIKGELLYVGSVNHKNLPHYKTEIQTFLNRY